MKRLLVLIVAVGAVVAAAAFTVPSNAGSVNGTPVSQQTLNENLSAIAGSEGFQCYLYAQEALSGTTQSGNFPIEGVGVPAGTTNPSTFNASFTRYWLSELLNDQLVAGVVADEHLTVTPASRAIGRVVLGQQIDSVIQSAQSSGINCPATSTAILASLPATFTDQLVQAVAEQDLLLSHAAGYSLATGGLTRYYTVHRTDFTKLCFSYALFTSSADATAARAKVAAGTSFTSVGTVTPIGCGLRTTATSELPSGVATLPVGQVSQPASLGNGQYALFEMTSQQAATFVTVRATVETAILAAGEKQAAVTLRAAAKRAQITADPRYGLVQSGTVALLPPASPAGSFVLNPSANQPAVTSPASAG
ncbi:MAG TPA: hypothetical protein VHX40_08620 [Acidimicrobiales bacterium]|nr:hypothetical protein [Acidimicrobiales bacterium]